LGAWVSLRIRSRGAKTFEFRTDAWSEAYIRRIDDTIAALKTAGVPIFWVDGVAR
jgi:hypothetical protein